MHGGKLGKIRVGHEDIQRLALADVGAAVSRHVDDGFLLDLPGRFVQLLEVCGDFSNSLNRAVGCDQLVFHGIIPEADLHQVTQEVLIHYHKLTGKYPTAVDIGSVRFEALVVAQDLAGGGCWHGRQQ
ncbi:hypothetical protein FQZ97_832020 [compost metagenome]